MVLFIVPIGVPSERLLVPGRSQYGFQSLVPFDFWPNHQSTFDFWPDHQTPTVLVQVRVTDQALGCENYLMTRLGENRLLPF